MSKKQKQWQPKASLEQSKLAPKEDDWRLATTPVAASRTRYGGLGRPNLPSTSPVVLAGTDSNEDDDESSFMSDDSVELSDDHDWLSDLSEETKPSGITPTRMIVKVNQVKSVLEEFSQCKICGGPLEASLKAKGYGLATKVELSCLKPTCSFVHHGEVPAATRIHQDDRDGYDRLTDHAINCIYVLSFIASGNGAMEAEKLLGLLGLPNATSMGSSTFNRIETRVGPYIWEISQQILLENIKKEVRLTLATESDYDQWERSIDSRFATPPLPRERYPKINCSYDHAWQQKSSGHRRDSPSGHGVIFGHRTRLPLAFEIKSKLCDFCTLQRRRYPDRQRQDYPMHDCTRNYEGSSGAMEAESLVELVIRLYSHYNVMVGKMCCDDDSSVRSDCQWDNATYLQRYNTTVLPQVKITRGPNKGNYRTGRIRESYLTL